MRGYTGARLGLLDCALIAISGGCPPESAFYLCAMGEMDADAECDCEGCWRAYLIYVADRRRHDPYASMRVDE